MEVRGAIFNGGPVSENVPSTDAHVKVKGTPVSKNSDSDPFLSPGSAREPHSVSPKRVSIATGALSSLCPAHITSRGGSLQQEAAISKSVGLSLVRLPTGRL